LRAGKVRAASAANLPQHSVGRKAALSDAASERLTNLQEKSNAIVDLGAKRLADLQAPHVVNQGNKRPAFAGLSWR
jgi:prophage maintenance system killer protein